MAELSTEVPLPTPTAAVPAPVASAEALHLLLGNHLHAAGVISVMPQVFAEQRRHAERRAARGGTDTPPLPRIAHELAESLGDPHVTPALLEHEELALVQRLNGARRPIGAPDDLGAPTRYETIMERHRAASGGLSSLMAAASRAARTAQHPGDEREAALASVAAGVMAPTLTAWVLWMIRRAQRAGCERIYYMSRDGQVLVDIARGLERRLGTGIEHRYLYGGRQASTSLRALDASFSLYDLDDDELAELLPEHLRHRESWDRMMYGDQEELRKALESEKAQAMLRAGTERARQLLISYLRQEGWDEHGNYALVDVGWRGRIPAALASTIADTDVSMPDELLYFGLEKGALDRMPPHLAPHLRGYFFDRSRDEGYVGPLPGIQVMIEMFCVADHAPVTGYTRGADGRIGPVIDGAFDEAVAWGLPHVRRTVDAFVEALVLDDDLVDPWTDLRPMVDELLRAFWTAPTREEVGAWGAFPVASDEVHSTHYQIAKPVTIGWITQAARTRLRKRRAGAGEPTVGHIWYWPAGVVSNSAAGYRVAFKASTRLRRELPRTRRRVAELRDRVQPGR